MSFACAKRLNNNVVFAIWLLQLIMLYIIKWMLLTWKCDDFEIFWFNLKRKRRQRNDDLISLKSKMKNCLIFSKQSVSESRMNFLKKKLILWSKLRKRRSERKSKRKMKLTLLWRLKMNMKRNYLWIVWRLRSLENNASNVHLKTKIKIKIKFIK